MTIQIYVKKGVQQLLSVIRCHATLFQKWRERLLAGLGIFICLSSAPHAQTWTPLTNQPSFNASTALQLTDGTIMVQAFQSGSWWRLIPDDTGSYINGTWSQLASMPAGYAPLYYASAVLPDGRVIVEGGEYNTPGPASPASPAEGGPPPPPRTHTAASGACTPSSLSALGAIYNPTTNSWTAVSPPSGWSSIGDAAGAVLANGTFMLNGFDNNQLALLNASTLTWSVINPVGKSDCSDEEGWTLLPNGTLLTVDAWITSNSEVYSPSTTAWSSIAMPNNLADLSPCEEMGPAVLRPGATVFATGSNGSTAIFNSTSGSWSAGPLFPSEGGKQLGVVDGPAAILPDGNVLTTAAPVSTGSTCQYNSGSYFFEFNGSSFVAVSAPPGAASNPTYVGRMLVLPTGQILYTNGTSSVQVYSPTGTYQPSWQPVIASVPAILTAGFTYTVTGTQFNGLSQGAMYGDDAQMATNYPLARITNNSTGHVTYARTHNHSTMGVATGSTQVSTEFDVPKNIEVGPGTLEVVANGIPSAPVSVTFSRAGAWLVPIINLLLNN
jgi:hypothetical protein